MYHKSKTINYLVGEVPSVTRFITRRLLAKYVSWPTELAFVIRSNKNIITSCLKPRILSILIIPLESKAHLAILPRFHLYQPQGVPARAGNALHSKCCIRACPREQRKKNFILDGAAR